MSISNNIYPYLPFLRRFARALTGSQVSGDNCVAALLESIVADVSILSGGRSPRVVLYRAFCRLFGPAGLGSRVAAATGALEATIQDRLGNLTGPARQAFLLQAVEGFSLSETADVLGKSELEVTALTDEANRQISEMISSDVLIIEDEPLIAADIEDIVTSLGHRATAIARTRRDAVRFARELRPQLVLSDIHLADGSSGIDAVNDILQSLSMPVIFITAFPERLLTGERPEPAFLITKPFSTDMVKALIAQALFFDMRARKAA
jgi:CheY-like chemotaxis protein/DNA-directed RNA polymerase specialized sigma24 family protein